MRRQRRHRAAVLAVIPALALGLAGCGSDDGGNAADKARAELAANRDKARKFAQCMRDQGIDMPDPQVNADGGIAFNAHSSAEGGKPASAVDRKKTEAAMEKCRPLLPDAGEPPKVSAEELDRLRKFAKCMREQGIDMPDPDPNGGISVERRPGNDDEMEEARQACRQFQPDRLKPQRMKETQ